MTRPYEHVLPSCLPTGYTPSPAAERMIVEVDLICCHHLGGPDCGGLRSSQVIGLIIALDRRGLITEPLDLEDVTFE